jgi:uncharacterized protein YdaT
MELEIQDIYIESYQEKSEGTLEKSKSEEKENSFSTKDITIHEDENFKKERDLLNGKRMRSDGLSDDDEINSNLEKIKEKKQKNENRQKSKIFSQIKRSIEVIQKFNSHKLIIAIY